MEEIWYLQDEIDGKRVWGLFETQLLRKQLLNGIAAGLHHEKVVDQIDGIGGYVAVLQLENSLVVFARKYRAYILNNDVEWTNDVNKEIDVVSDPTGVLVIADGDLNIGTQDCTQIKADNKKHVVYCIDFKTNQVVDEQYFYTHDNGGRPFKVKLNGDVVVYKHDANWEVDKYETEPLFTFEPERVFIGRSPFNEMTEFSGGYGPDFDGNSILLKVGDNRYIFIGKSIIEFDTLAEITEFVSPVGNNDVPYPFAIDSHGNYYLMIEDVIIKEAPEGIDPYQLYYNRNLITADIGRVPPQQPVLENFGITEFYNGDDQYTLRYTPFPTEYYDRIVPELGRELYLVKGGEKKLLTKNDYVKLIEDFGKILKAQPLHTTILQKRL